MKKYFTLFILLISIYSIAQDKKINIESADLIFIDEDKYPGATVGLGNVFIEVDGGTLQCKKAILHNDSNYLEALGKVILKQGDTITQTSRYVNYDGRTKQALSWGDVVLKNQTMTMETDTLHFDRVSQQLFYNNGAVIKDQSNTLKSKNGYYFLSNHKFQAKTAVEIVNKDFLLNSNHLDYYTDSGIAYLYGESTIKGKETFISGEKGFSDTKAGTSYFTKNSYILYKDRRIEADSLYYDKNKAFASATNNIVLTDTINKTVLKGNYAEYYRALDSAFVVKKAVAISETKDDKIYIHGDTILLTGKPDSRIIRAYHHVKFFKSDLQGKCDSIHSNQKNGIMKMFEKPVLWTDNGQITGKLIQLITNTETEKLDSLKVLGNAFLIQKDSVKGFNQIKGRNMFAKFTNNNIEKVDFIGNGEVLAYIRDNDKDKSLFGISKTTCERVQFTFKNKQIVKSRFYKQEETTTYPPSELPENARELRDFIWRDEERPKTKDDIFIH